MYIHVPLWTVFDHQKYDFYSCNYLSFQFTLKFTHAILAEFMGMHNSLQIFYKTLLVEEKLLKQERTQNWHIFFSSFKKCALQWHFLLHRGITELIQTSKITILAIAYVFLFLIKCRISASAINQEVYTFFAFPFCLPALEEKFLLMTL